jgi:hypothetical protein
MELEGYDLTAHATTVIARRGIDVEWLRATVTDPDRTERDGRDPELVHAFRRIAARDDRVLRVVYNDSVVPARIVTAYFDRRQRGKP